MVDLDKIDLLKDNTDRLSKRLGEIEAHVLCLDQRIDSCLDIKPIKEETRSVRWYACFTKVLIGLIILFQLGVGGLIALRLGPEGYNRAQARANWKDLCLEIHKIHPEINCPTIVYEEGDSPPLIPKNY